MKTIQGLENSGYVKEELRVFEKSVLHKKNSYNKIHHENAQKEEHLEQLESQLEMLVSQYNDYSGQQNHLKVKDHDCNTLNRKLKEQLKDQKVLENMVITRKIEFNKMSEPINNKKKEINMLNFLIEKHSKDIQKETSAIFQYNKEIDIENKFLEKITKAKEQKIDVEIKNFADKKKFRYYMKKEQEKNNMLERHTNEAKVLLKLEVRLAKMKEDELLSEEIKKIEAHCLREEQKFLEIQKATNIVAVSDMYPHFLYLIENESRLKHSVDSALAQIDKLNKEREHLSKELEELSLRALNNQQYNKDIQLMEEKFKKRAMFIDSYEDYVEKLEDIASTATNSVSRLIYQLDLTNEVGQLEPSNMIECFKRCKNKLDMLIEFIKKSDFELTESVNTDINIRRSPNFLNLNLNAIPKKT